MIWKKKKFKLAKRIVIIDWSELVQAFIMLSCLIAVAVNFSTFLVLGKTSPVTYQVLGHLKTCLILGFGYTLLRDPFTERNIIGILIAVWGMGLYSYFCTQESKKKPSSEAPLLVSQVKPSLPFFFGIHTIFHMNLISRILTLLLLLFYFLFS